MPSEESEGASQRVSPVMCPTHARAFHCRFNFLLAWCTGRLAGLGAAAGRGGEKAAERPAGKAAKPKA
jgi:hypothetical protein